MDATPDGAAALMGVRDYARRVGLNPSTISRQIRKGAIPNRGTRDRPLIDPAEADQARANNLQHLKARNRGGPLGYERSLEEADAAREPPPIEEQDAKPDATERADSDRRTDGPRKPGLTQAVTAEKAVRTQLLLLDLEERNKTLCDVAGVEQAAAIAIDELHALLAQRNRDLAERVARESDPNVIEQQLAESDRDILARWARTLTQEIEREESDAKTA